MENAPLINSRSMRLSKNCFTFVVLALCIMLAISYYNTFQLINTVNFKNTVYLQTVHYIEIDTHKETKSYKENNAIKFYNNYIDNNDYKKTSKNYESYYDPGLVLVNYNIMESNDNLVNENANVRTNEYYKANDIMKKNSIENDRNRNNIEEVRENYVKLEWIHVNNISDTEKQDELKIDTKEINDHTNIFKKTEKHVKLLDYHANVTINHEDIPDKDFLINTPGCLIPDYGKTMIFNEATNMRRTCGKRAVFIYKVLDDEIIFRINEKRMNYYKMRNQTYKCCYKYVSRPTSTNPGIQDTKITYSPCMLFKNNTRIKLKLEIIFVSCGKNPLKISKIIYEDVYIIVKKVKKGELKVNNKSWNVLIVGMDTMSRARAQKNMPLTMQYFRETGWLDYRGYQKVGYNTFPNLVAFLTGKSNIYNVCKPSIDHCNDLFIWTKYRNASYATAYGEDDLRVPDTFKNYGGFEIPPTDHYMRPFYLTGEHVTGNLVCTKKVSSGIHMLRYMYDLTQTYEGKNFFGIFWINSYSHNNFSTPVLFDKYTRYLFKGLSMTGTLNNTFIIFLSDHGTRYGEMRYSVESYYEERLPMFYMWVPYEFQKDHIAKYNNLKLNQHRLTTPYDLHATLWEILRMSRDSVTVIKPEACPNCTSLFEEKSVHRTCAEAAVDKKWCSCHKLEPVDLKDAESKHCLELAVSSIQNITKDIKTIECTRCSTLRLKKVLRIHSYYDNAINKTYFIVAFLLSPGDVGYEVTIEKDYAGYNVVTPTTTITTYNNRGGCTVKKLTDRPYCVCENIPKCHKKPKS